MFPGAVNVGAQGNDPDQGTAQSLSLSTCCCRTAQSGYRTADDGRLQEDESEQRLRVAFVDGSLPEDIVRAVAERFSLEHWKVERNAHLPATDAGRVVACAYHDDDKPGTGTGRPPVGRPHSVRMTCPFSQGHP